ncbi:unnamed protein product, partial [Amoebophrya sp. A120]|eukprot:GSA120T00003265001.1
MTLEMFCDHVDASEFLELQKLLMSRSSCNYLSGLHKAERFFEPTIDGKRLAPSSKNAMFTPDVASLNYVLNACDKSLANKARSDETESVDCKARRDSVAAFAHELFNALVVLGNENAPIVTRRSGHAKETSSLELETTL